MANCCTKNEKTEPVGIKLEGNNIEQNIESWLDDHPEFVHSYFTRKASRTLIDSWLQSRSLRTPTPSGTPPPSGSSTPVRKISASEFEGRGILKPLVNVVDGQATFLSPSEPSRARSPHRNRKSRVELLQLDETELLMELVKDIASDLDVKCLCHKILQNVSILVNGDRCSLFLLQGPKDGPRYLVSKVFDVNAESKLEDMQGLEEIRIPLGTGIVGYTADTGEVVNIANAYEDSRFNQEIDKKTGYHTRSILCMPIRDHYHGEIIGVAQVINKRGFLDHTFTREDEKIFSKYLVFCGIGITNAELYERAQLEIRRNQVLLDLARTIFEEQSTLHNIVQKIMMITQTLLQCERCSVLLVDPTSKTLFSQAFDLEARDYLNEDDQTVVKHRSCSKTEVRFPINIGITGHVATTGETLNIPNAYQDERFDPAVDQASGFVTQTILCMPIKNSSEEIIGVVQLLNKLDGTAFNKNDENLFEAFAIFCGMAIQNTVMYENVNKAMAKQKVALEVLSYHAAAPLEEANKLKSVPIPSIKTLKLLEFTFDDELVSDQDTLLGTLAMVMDLKLHEHFNVEYQVLCRWILTVKKNYRPVMYHNWRHAFNVAQTMFTILKVDEFGKLFTPEEKFALLVACLSHDLDHRGTNNSFQIKSASALAQLYSTSTMEHHHFDQCIMIINSQGNEIFGSLSAEDYNKVIKLVEQAIIATDLALYFQKRAEFFKKAEAGCEDWSSNENRELLRAMMMTACDLSAITKPWPVQRRTALLVAEEFFQQGDLEQQELKSTPMAMMDRAKKDELPQMQVGFIDSVCLPLYKAFTQMSPKLAPLKEGCRENKLQWQKLADDYKAQIENTVWRKR
ncbi:dual 3',5'-cyclic-AMP and -GMP phosphodiesterase 11-like isoform X1 [Stylophora pistillata]|uniref:Phosphodiesterase n=1 Tax=Stylophora pistillata TaxID=50429 RepID=A0A2B4SF15_STYPI|nr:dual 3',5'-cyclic-AMP and -GMP phosphodiesterase 11-like isoform X1 [Stylophora pistillata]PFX27035.1 Dual 3',5'-cyclic-AMP and -GMP phosphodiesterase 11 [Stylophora pistillata]